MSLNSTEAKIDADLKFFLVQIHATCLIFAWFFICIVSNASARYLRQLFPNYRPFGLLIWFHIHRSLNLIALTLMIAGLLSVFIAYEWGWKGPRPNGPKNWSAGSIHSLFGIISCGIAFIQPFVAWFRCGPDDPKRPTFNTLHRTLGISALTCAAICLGIACFFFKKRLISTEAAFTLYLVNVGAVLVVVFGLEYWTTHKQNQKRVSENGKASNRRLGPIPFVNCLAVLVLSCISLIISSLICIFVWLK